MSDHSKKRRWKEEYSIKVLSSAEGRGLRNQVALCETEGARLC